MAIAGIVLALASIAGRAQTPAAPAPTEPAPIADLRVPPGFRISAFASNLQGARLMAVTPEGVLLVARRRTNEVVALPDTNGDGVAEAEVLLTGLTNAHSLAFKDGYLYVATTPAIMRVRWSGGRPVGQPETFAELPTSTPSLHISRTIRVGRDGRLYLSIGSSCNVCVEPDSRRTTIQVFPGQGAGFEPYAVGLRNAIGFDWEPGTGRMWSTDIGQDGSGPTFPPDEINLIDAGKHYGYPFFVGGNIVNDVPELKGVAPTVTAKDAVVHAFALPAHVTPIDLRFYTGTRFPPEYRGMYIAFHGSSTIPEKVGYKVIRVVMKDGRPAAIEDFVTGWLKDGAVSGRPAGLITGADGALYISDDNRGYIYRVTYDK